MPSTLAHGIIESSEPGETYNEEKSCSVVRVGRVRCRFTDRERREQS